MASEWLKEIEKKGIDVEKLNNDIKQFPQVKPLEEGDDTFRNGVGRMVMLDRYAFKDTEQLTIGEGDIVILTVKDDPSYPTRGIGKIKGIDTYNRTATILVEEEYRANIEDPARQKSGIVKRKLDEIDKPLELAYEQIAHRVASGLSRVEDSKSKQDKAFKDFKDILSDQSLVPAGRVLYGAGSEADVTFFNCFSGDTPVQTEDGVVDIKTLAESDKEIHRVFSEDGEVREAEFRQFGEQELYEVILANGESFKATAGHEWVVQKGNKPYREKVTTLDLEGRRIPYIRTPHKKDEEEYLKGIQNGIVYGDGSKSKSPEGESHVLLFGDKKEYVKYFKEYKQTEHYGGEYTRVYGMPESMKELPKEGASESYWQGFVEGFIGTDGNVDTRGSVTVHQASLEDLNYVAKNLSKTSFGFSSVKMKRGISPFNKEYAPLYGLTFIKSTVTENEIIRPSHKEKFKNSPKPKNQWIRVEKVVPLEVTEPVYCAVEPETNTFVIGTGYLTGNCFVLPYPKDSREGLSEHRATAMEIMSRGGGVGTNGSTLRPSNALARGVNGKSSGSVSWLHDLSELTHLIQQGGSRRGAQMIMLQVDHPDIIEFIISKMQNPRILRYIIENIEDEQIKQLAQDKLKFTPLTQDERTQYETISAYKTMPGKGGFNDNIFKKAEDKLRDGGTYSVNEPDFLTGANISVAITNDFMKALEQEEEWELRFPDTDNYTEEEMHAYDTEWHEVGDVREWEKLGYGVKTYRTIKAKELWNLINICATYAAEPGIFFIDRANEDTNAKAYGQKVVATNPCGEQPLAGFSVCNLSAINLAEVADKENNEVEYDKLKVIVQKAVRLQDNIIDATPYFLDENEEQAFGERRIGLGVMGLADLLIYNKKRYGSKEGNELVDKVFETIAVTAYETSIELSKEKGAFPFLIGETEEETLELRNKFINTGYMKRMPEHIREGVLKHGIRNSHLLTVAPTGSTGTMVGVSTGLEPYFAFKYFRSGRLGKFIEVNQDIVQEYLDTHPEADADNLPDFFVSAMELSPEDHVDVQTTIQRWVDSSISKTVNAPAGYSVEEVQKVYERLYKGGAKGGTVYVDGSRDSQVLTLKAEENDVDATEYKESTGSKDVRVVDDVKELKQLVNSAKKEHALKNGDTDDVVYGSEIGDTCPICRQGTVADIGGCNTCTNCQAQLRCGL